MQPPLEVYVGGDDKTKFKPVPAGEDPRKQVDYQDAVLEACLLYTSDAADE